MSARAVAEVNPGLIIDYYVKMASSRKEYNMHDFPDPAAYARLKHEHEFLRLRKRSLLVGSIIDSMVRCNDLVIFDAFMVSVATNRHSKLYTCTGHKV